MPKGFDCVDIIASWKIEKMNMNTTNTCKACVYPEL